MDTNSVGSAHILAEDNAFARRYPDFGRRMQEDVRVGLASRNVDSAEDAAFEQLRHFQNFKRDSQPLWGRGRCDAAGQSDEFCDELPHARNWCKILPEPRQGPDLPQFAERLG